MVSATPSRITPRIAERSPTSAIISERSPISFSAYTINCRPLGVGEATRWSRLRSFTPISRSSWAMRCEIAGWVVLSRCAAPRKLPSVTTHRKVSSDLKSTIGEIQSINLIYRFQLERKIRLYSRHRFDCCRDNRQDDAMTVLAAEQQF